MKMGFKVEICASTAWYSNRRYRLQSTRTYGSSSSTRILGSNNDQYSVLPGNSSPPFPYFPHPTKILDFNLEDSPFWVAIPELGCAGRQLQMALFRLVQVSLGTNSSASAQVSITLYPLPEFGPEISKEKEREAGAR